VENLQEIRNLVEKRKLHVASYSVWNVKSNPEIRNFLKIGNNIWDGIILEEDVALELGSNDYPLIKTIITLKDLTAIHDSRITLIGENLEHLQTIYTRFGFIILIGSNSLKDSELRQIQRSVLLTHSVEGIIEKQFGRHSWYQISRNLLERGLKFSHLGYALMHLAKQSLNEKIEAIEILMAINDDPLLDYFGDLHEISRIESILQFRNKIEEIQKLRPDCDLQNECDVCDNREICDQIRDIITKRSVVRRKSP
jgi:CO dehydrogenase/acetyl-CoA synthase beta subunit